MARVSQSAFAAAVADLGRLSGQPDLAERILFRPQPVTLATRFMAAEAAAAALTAGAALADRIAVRRGAPPGQVEAASRHVEASLLSFAHLKFLQPDGSPPARQAPEQRTAAAGFHRTADDRWVYLHPGFPHNTEGLLRLLDVPDDRDAARAAVAARSGDALEDAIAEAGLCGAMARSAEEWDASVPGRMLAGRPVVDVVQLGDSAPEPMPSFSGADSRPLNGIRVLDLTRVLAGPTCARTLASYGARALRIGAPQLPSVPLFVADTGFGKRSAHLDLTRPDDAQTLRRLVRDSDVFSQGYRTGAMDGLGFGVTDVSQLRPGIVYVSINCYGHDGPWRQRPGWEQLAQTVTGMALQHGRDTAEAAEDDPATAKPSLLPAAVTDYTTGYLAAFGVLAALERRARVGGSYWVRVSLARTGMWVRGLGRRRSLAATPLGRGQVARLQDRMETPWGPLRFLQPAVSLSTSRVGWTLPPVPLGTHPASFADD